jgi:hypothetical protein
MVPLSVHKGTLILLARQMLRPAAAIHVRGAIGHTGFVDERASLIDALQPLPDDAAAVIGVAASARPRPIYHDTLRLNAGQMLLRAPAILTEGAFVGTRNSPDRALRIDAREIFVDGPSALGVVGACVVPRAIDHHALGLDAGEVLHSAAAFVIRRTLVRARSVSDDARAVEAFQMLVRRTPAVRGAGTAVRAISVHQGALRLDAGQMPGRRTAVGIVRTGLVRIGGTQDALLILADQVFGHSAAILIHGASVRARAIHEGTLIVLASQMFLRGPAALRVVPAAMGSVPINQRTLGLNAGEVLRGAAAFSIGRTLVIPFSIHDLAGLVSAFEVLRVPCMPAFRVVGTRIVTGAVDEGAL